MITRQEAKKLAETVTPEELKQMFLNAQEKITDWTKVSRVNKGLTKGVAFNILSKCVNDTSRDKLAITNMIHEFGEYLPNFRKEIIEKKPQPKPTHQEPITLSDDWFDKLFD